MAFSDYPINFKKSDSRKKGRLEKFRTPLGGFCEK